MSGEMKQEVKRLKAERQEMLDEAKAVVSGNAWKNCGRKMQI